MFLAFKLTTQIILYFIFVFLGSESQWVNKGLSIPLLSRQFLLIHSMNFVYSLISNLAAYYIYCLSFASNFDARHFNVSILFWKQMFHIFSLTLQIYIILQLLISFLIEAGINCVRCCIKSAINNFTNNCLTILYLLLYMPIPI